MTIWTELTPTPFQVGFVDAGPIRTRSLRAGSGEDVLFLHGTSGHLEAFVRNIPAHAEHFTCHAIDMVGHGYTDKPDYPLRIARYVDHVLAYIDALGIERVHIVGESLGGWVAARFAAEHPDRVGGITLAVPGGTLVDGSNMARIIASITNAVVSGDRELTRKRLEGLMFHKDGNVTDELIDVRFAIYQQADFRAALDNLLVLQDQEIRSADRLTDEELRALTTPTLLVWGAQNPHGGVEEAERLHALIPGAQLEVFDECGHWPQHEFADRFNAINIGFLQGL